MATTEEMALARAEAIKKLADSLREVSKAVTEVAQSSLSLAQKVEGIGVSQDRERAIRKSMVRWSSAIATLMLVALGVMVVSLLRISHTQRLITDVVDPTGSRNQKAASAQAQVIHQLLVCDHAYVVHEIHPDNNPIPKECP